ncbi:MAG: ABC transporter substrate-binding protein [Treponema sp.]|jgi:peptide/nickel transport system substrate-binding protein|nr:ABC transporter substrate-binding protein [Treponema sp.]
MKKTLFFVVSLFFAAAAVFAGAGREAQAAPAKDTIVFGVNLSATGLFHPTLNTSNADREVVFLVFNRLVATDPSGNYVPELAESYTASPDARVYTFKLRKDVTWTDGQPFTAEDVAFTYETTAHPKFFRGIDEFARRLEGAEAYHEGTAPSVAGIKVLDPYTVSFTFAAPYRDAMVKFIDIPVLAKHIWSKAPVESWMEQGDLLRNPVGTGPYKLAEYVQDQYVRLERNEAYFKGAPKIKTFILKRSNPDTRQIEVINGELDAARVVSWKDRDLSEYTRRNIPIVEVKSIMAYYIVFNSTDEVFQDPRVRLAAVHALDRQALITAIENGHAVTAETLISPNQLVYPKDITPYDFNIAKSLDLLREAGYTDTNGDGIVEKNGQPLKVTLRYDNVDDTVLAQLVQAQLKKGGFDVEIIGSDFNTVLGILRSTTEPFQIAFMGATYRPNPGYGAGHMWMARYVNDEENNRLIAQANGSTNDQEAIAHFGAWGKYFHDQAPIAVLYFKSTGYAVNPRLVGYEPTTTEWFPNVETWYFK